MLLKGLPRLQFLSPVCTAWKSGSMQQCALGSSFKRVKLDKHAPGTPPLTLFEELFPEESKLPRKPQSSSRTNADPQGSQRDDLLREFQWAISKPKDTTSKAQNTSAEPQEDTTSTTGQDNYELRKHRDASILVLSNASKSLALSDFLRLSPKGTHIDNWASGIIKGKFPHYTSILVQLSNHSLNSDTRPFPAYPPTPPPLLHPLLLTRHSPRLPKHPPPSPPPHPRQHPQLPLIPPPSSTRLHKRR
jgi:hypothetical protein